MTKTCKTCYYYKLMKDISGSWPGVGVCAYPVPLSVASPMKKVADDLEGCPTWKGKR